MILTNEKPKTENRQPKTDPMPYGFYISAEGANAQSQRMEVITNNIANAETTGFRREMVIVQARNSEAIQQGRDSWDSGSINMLGGGVLPSDSQTNFEVGAYENTGAKDDLAIMNQEGFFALQHPDGEVHLSRAGNFQFDNEGQLIAQYGATRYEVLNSDMQPITLEDPNGQYTFGSEGTLQQNGAIQELAIVQPNDPLAMRHEGGNTFTALSGFKPVEQAERRTDSGFLEQSNVSPTREVVSMIQAQRMFEANVKMMQTQDEMLGGLLSRVLRV